MFPFFRDKLNKIFMNSWMYLSMQFYSIGISRLEFWANSESFMNFWLSFHLGMKSQRKKNSNMLDILISEEEIGEMREMIMKQMNRSKENK
jgi:hypothetical protein